VRVDRPCRLHIEKLAAHLLIYAACSPTQTSILTNSQISWSGYKQHFAATTSRKRLLRGLPGNANRFVLLSWNLLSDDKAASGNG